MRVESVDRYKLPYYPDKKAVLKEPDILKSIPQRWKGNVKVGIALSSLLFLMITGCEGNGTVTGSESVTASPIDKNRKVSPTIKIPKEGKAAPVFAHGDGRGSYGCDSVAPPVFLSEEEAIEVIREEALLQGIDLSDKDIMLENVDIPVTNLYPRIEPGENYTDNKPTDTQKGTLVLDGYDGERRIGFEYVSIDDCKKWHKDTGIWCSVEDYNTIDTARTLREGITDKTGDKIVGVFYEPLNGALGDKDYLREQVKDFLNWLKAEGII